MLRACDSTLLCVPEAWVDREGPPPVLFCCAREAAAARGRRHWQGGEGAGAAGEGERVSLLLGRADDTAPPAAGSHGGSDALAAGDLPGAASTAGSASGAAPQAPPHVCVVVGLGCFTVVCCGPPAPLAELLSGLGE